MKRIVILGSTGSIGVSALDVIASHPGEFRVIGLSANTNAGALSQQISRFQPKIACLMNPPTAGARAGITGSRRTRIVAGIDGLIEIVTRPDVDLVLFAIMGSVSLLPLLAAIRAKKAIALASKEALVCGGEIVMREAAKYGVRIIPVDSEHSAIFQCLEASKREHLRKIHLTGTGGPLRRVALSRFSSLEPATVVHHPRWKMGKKISVDSATLMNKGLEVIEAMRLFNVGLEDISVLIHPQAIIHSLVEFIDGSVLAQLGVPDMRLPIQYAMSYPRRLPTGHSLRLDFQQHNKLTFERPRLKKFPCLELAFYAARKGGTFPAVLNASNEEAVMLYLDGTLPFNGIPRVVGKVLSLHRGVIKPGIEQIVQADTWAREEARIHCSR
ncbi:MAG: 1-deoxy-D-xylulose-5-phosphate reductoisomerase [Candidatus Omnitrophota bacterium]